MDTLLTQEYIDRMQADQDRHRAEFVLSQLRDTWPRFRITESLLDLTDENRTSVALVCEGSRRFGAS